MHTVISSFNPEKMESLLQFSQVFCFESKGIVNPQQKNFIVMYLSRHLQEKQGYPKSKNILNYEMSLVYGMSP
jgi:hypothetical protein